jgi:hypothetical protein
VRILTPDKKQPIVVSQPAHFEIGPGGDADNIHFFVNVTFQTPGEYWLQTLVDSSLFKEQALLVTDARRAQGPESMSEAVN